MFLVNVILFIFCLNAAESKILPAKGPCLTLDNCPALNGLIQSRRNSFGTRILLNALHCYSRDDEFYLRCPTLSEINEFISKTELLPSQEDCGLQGLTSKIDKGEIADLEDFPWLALIKYQSDGNRLKYGCTGNLISKRYILTAAHCVDRTWIRQNFGYIHKIVLGEYDIYNTTDCYYNEHGPECTDGIQEYSVESYHIHPEFDIPSGKGDIALIRLDRDVQMTDFIKPICLPAGVLHIASEEKMWIAGWGENSTFDLNAVKMKARFQKLDNTKCESSVKITENHICTGSIKDAKTCPGDSGGPLMVLRKAHGNHRYYLAGVLSLGPKCYSDSQISIYTRVSAYLGWIMEHIH